MKIGIHNNELDGRGTGKSCRDYGRALTARGHHVFFLAPLQANNIGAAELQALGTVVLYPLETTRKAAIEQAVERHQIDFLHMIKSGEDDGLTPTNCRTGIQCVFDMSQPHGTVYAGVSDYLVARFGRTLCVPPIVNVLPPTRNIRSEHGIPDGAVVFGRHGGRSEFDLPIAHRAVETALRQRADIFFLFLSTDRFIEHERAIFIPWVQTDQEVANFIHSCDAMIHARRRGESFGSAVGEFSAANKPVITWSGSGHNFERAHLQHLGSRAIPYTDEHDLARILCTWYPGATTGELNVFSSRFGEERVMKIYHETFLQHPV